MIEREILIANNRDQSKYRVVTGAETLRELQQDIARNNKVYKMVGQTWIKNEQPINISGLTFTEGITKTQLLSPDTQLPTNVQFKGQTTNNLVMLLTNTNKQIRSGIVSYPTNRKDFGEFIKKNNLGDAIKAKFGDNWTRISTDKLVSFFSNADKKTSFVNNNEALNKVRQELNNQEKVKQTINTTETERPVVLPQEKSKPADVKSAPHAATVEWFYTGIKSMVKETLMTSEDVAVLASLLSELAMRLEEEKPEITISDMNDMMKSISH